MSTNLTTKAFITSEIVSTKVISASTSFISTTPPIFMDLFNTTYMITLAPISILASKNILLAANNLKKSDKLLPKHILIAILFLISACILIYFLWYKRRQMLIKEKNSIRFSASNFSELDSKI
jgi:hypothetical protein